MAADNHSTLGELDREFGDYWKNRCEKAEQHSANFWQLRRDPESGEWSCTRMFRKSVCADPACRGAEVDVTVMTRFWEPLGKFLEELEGSEKEHGE